MEGRASTKFLKKYIKSFPCFSLNDEGEEQREEFNFGKIFNLKLDVLIDVARLKEGVGFGELALLNDAPRSATIRSVTDTHFATLEKEDFKLVLGKVLKVKILQDIFIEKVCRNA